MCGRVRPSSDVSEIELAGPEYARPRHYRPRGRIEERDEKLYAIRGVFETSMTPHEKAETGVSFIITKAQKAELHHRGYTEEQIREMKPEEAHRALGLIS
jgi:hypothetical protein